RADDAAGARAAAPGGAGGAGLVARRAVRLHHSKKQKKRWARGGARRTSFAFRPASPRPDARGPRRPRGRESGRVAIATREVGHARMAAFRARHRPLAFLIIAGPLLLSGPAAGQ